jgi:Ala-tRNA(Pro) deacylase
MPATRADLFACLEKLGIATSTVEHPPLFTVEQSQALRGEIPGGHTKNLFLKDKKDRVFLVVAEEDSDIDMKALHRRIGASGRLSFGRPELLAELLGLIPGAVTPFGAINDRGGRVTVVLDEALMRHERLNFHPLENTATTNISGADLVRFLRHTGHEPRILAVSGAERALAGLESGAERAT